MRPRPDPYDVAREKAEKAVLEAEQFKATINVPQSMHVGINDNQYFSEEIKDDDEFFHITCHVEPSLVEKISKGEYVELNKLLPKSHGVYYGQSENKTELVFREGKPVFISHIDKSRVVNGVHRWEQTFRVYVATYSQAYPHCVAEIWQYVFTINSAAASYAWPNVAEYDFAFRQMMSKNPKRSWSKIYTQMWNRCLTESVHNCSFKQGQGQPNFRQNGQSHNNAGTATKPSYCWKFNKNGKCKFGSNCKFVNRCSYCDGASHGNYNCPRKTNTGAQNVEQVENV